MSKEKDGGSAFPVFDGRVGADYQCIDAGMSLHDWYAGQALNGLLSSGSTWKIGTEPINTQERYAKTAFDFADAMIAEKKRREKKRRKEKAE